MTDTPRPTAADDPNDTSDPVSSDGTDDEDDPRLVRFVIGGRPLLIEVGSVLEVLVTGPVTRLPGAAPAIVGVTSVRGRIIAVLDVSAALGVPPPVDRSRLLVVSTPAGPVALLVDRVDAVVAASIDEPEVPDTRSAPDTAPGPVIVAIATVDGEPLRVIDPAALIEVATAPHIDPRSGVRETSAAGATEAS